MKKKIIATLICTAMLLSACGNKVEPMPEKAEVNEIHVDDGQVTDNSGTNAFDAAIKYLTFNNADSALTEISMVNTGWDGPYLYDSETTQKIDTNITSIMTPLADFISNSTGETVTLAVYDDLADVSPKDDIINNIYKVFERAYDVTDGQLAAVSSFAEKWMEETLVITFNEGAGMIEDASGTKYSVTEIDVTIKVNDIPSSFVYGYSVVIGQKTVVLKLDNAAWRTIEEIKTGTTNEIVENEVIGDIVSDEPTESESSEVIDGNASMPASYEEYTSGKEAGKYSEYADGFLVNLDETKTVDLGIGNIDSASLAEGSIKIADITVSEDKTSLNLKGIAGGTAVVNVSYTGENATVETAKYFIEVARAVEGGEETGENTEITETEEPATDITENTGSEITSSDEGSGSITETFRTFDEVNISSEQLVTASATETDFKTVMEEVGMGNIILNTYKTAGDPNKTTLNFFLSMVAYPEKPAISIGSKVYVKNSPIGSFSLQLPGSYTIIPSGSTSVLCFSDASSNNAQLTSFTLEMRKKDPMSDILSTWKSSETKKNLSPEAKKILVENSTSLQLYRTDFTFTTGIDESGASTGEAKTYEVLYMAEYGGYYVYAIVPYDDSPSENNGNTSLMIEQILTSLKLSEQASQNVVTENPESGENPAPTEETPVEKVFDKEAFNDELSLITNYEKIHGISQNIDLASYETIPDLTTLWSQKSITIKNASQFGSTYDLVTSLMEELGNPSTFIYYEYLSDSSTGVKQVYKPNTGEEFTPSYTFAVMSGAVYNIDGYIITACGYDERFKVTNTDEFGQSYDDPNTVTTSDGTQYTFYITDENLTVIGQVTYTK